MPAIEWKNGLLQNKFHCMTVIHIVIAVAENIFQLSVPYFKSFIHWK